MKPFAWAVMSMALSKVVLFIVEGETDVLALGAPLSKLFSSFKSSEFRFRVIHGDLITDRSYGSECSPNNVKKRIVEQAKIFLGRDKLKWSDLAAIVYLTDTDGAFIPASAVVKNDELDSVSYFLDHVESPYPASIVSRNKNKSACLKVLCRSGHLTYSGQRVAFKACYMSRNLEHALHGRVEEADTPTKAALSRKFATYYRVRPEAFAELATKIAPSGSYQDSWLYIADSLHSLERGSNLFQVLDFIVQSCLDR